MQHISWVHKEQSPQDLVNKVLDVLVTQLLPRVNHSMEVGFHQFSNDVNVRVSRPCLRLEDIHKANDVVVLKELWIMQWLLSNLISRTMRLASIKSSNALMTYLSGLVLFWWLLSYFSNDPVQMPLLHRPLTQFALWFRTSSRPQKECLQPNRELFPWALVSFPCCLFLLLTA